MPVAQECAHLTVVHRDGLERSLAMRPAFSRGKHLTLNGNLVAGPRRANGRNGRAVQVGARIVAQQIPYSRDAQPAERTRTNRPDSLQELHGAVPDHRRHPHNLHKRAFSLANPPRRC